MFLRVNNLNEGAFNKNAEKGANLNHCEGKNPKTNLLENDENVWHSTKKLTHVNSNWEKLRK